jgi:lipoprotein-anchoring transpeptidase ErfK/SrfK
MRGRSLIGVVILVAVLVLGTVAVWLYDHGQRDKLAPGVRIANIDVGGMRKNPARDKVRHGLTLAVNQPIVVQWGPQRFELDPRDAKVGYAVQAAVDKALSRGREGSIFSRAWRDLVGGELKINLQPKIAYSRAAVDRFVERITENIDRAPRDASLGYSATGLTELPERPGLKVNAQQLRNAVVFDLENQRYGGVLTPVVTRPPPKVTRAQLPSRYPSVIIINRKTKQLQLYKQLKPFKTYAIAVGQAGLQTPAGLHSVTDKSVNPTWKVPNESWAGSRAGTTVPGGAPDNPLKARWIGFYPGDGIHGTAEDWSIGTAASHGCIRMHIPDVKDLYNRVKLGDSVFVI